MPRLNDPRSHYASDEAPSLFWELTVSQSLAGLDSVSQAALERPGRYGEILARFLVHRAGLSSSWSVVEVGGGYGTLMASFLDVVPVQDLTMVDVSPFFCAYQRRALGARDGCRFVTADALEYLRGLDREVDLVVSNENLGDLLTVVGICKRELALAVESGSPADGPLGEVARAVRRFGLPLEDAPEVFHFNLGALEYLEALRPRARVVFVAEHGADTVLPPAYDFLPLAPGDGYPRRIRLRGHDEYTVRFGHLERAARVLGYRVERFHLAEVLGVRRDAGLRALARQGLTWSERTEAIHEFCEHVAEYQCMLLTR